MSLTSSPVRSGLEEVDEFSSNDSALRAIEERATQSARTPRKKGSRSSSISVVAPYLSGNGTAHWHSLSKAIVGQGDTHSQARSNVVFEETYSGITASRYRANCMHGNRKPDGGYSAPTPYESLSVRYRFHKGHWYNTHDRIGWSWLKRYEFVETTPICGFHGGVGTTGIGHPHQRYQLGITNDANLWHVNAYNRSIAEARLKLRDQRIDLSEALVGIPSTVRMIGERVSLLARAITAVRRRDTRSLNRMFGVRRVYRGADNTKSLAQLWLEWQFGWLPLMSDIQAGVELVNSTLTRTPEHFTVTRRVSDRLPEQGPYLSNCYALAYQFTGTTQAETKIVARVSDPELAYLVQLGIDNPLYIAWVAMPFSFVVDWLLPVADWLQALTGTLGLTFVQGYTSQRVVVKEYLRYAEKTGGWPYFYESGDGPAAEYQMVHVRRTKHSSFPLFYPYVTSPFTSARRIANALALVRSASNR